MPMTADAAQLCGITAIVGCAIGNSPVLFTILRKALAPDARSGYTAAVRGAQTLGEATRLKQFPYMELLDSNYARKEY